MGSHSLQAVYSGDSNFGGSSSSVFPLNVVSSFRVSLTVFPLQATTQDVVTMTGTVQYGQGTGGTVTFFDGNQTLGTVQVEGSFGSATLKSRFPPGTHTLLAVFNGLGQVTGSGATSSPQTLTVTGTEATISTLTATPNGGNYDFSLSVFGYGFPAPTGTAGLQELPNNIVIGNITLPGPGVASFQGQQIYPTGLTPRGIGVADFNGDGLPDLAVTNASSTVVSVLLGNGDGTFQPQQTYQVAHESLWNCGWGFQRRWHC